MNGRPRPSWWTYALDLAAAAAARSEDPYVQVGAVVLRKDNSVAGVGYNGAPPGVDLDWLDRDGRRDLVTHAEVNALRYCTPAVKGGLLAVTGTPCPACLTHIAPYGITTVIFRDVLDNYPIGESLRVANALDIRLIHHRFRGPVPPTRHQPNPVKE